MTDITGLSTKEKSELLAKAMGWQAWKDETTWHAELSGQWWLVDGEGERLDGLYNELMGHELTQEEAFRKVCVDLYEPASMSLAWHVARWAAGQEQGAIAWEFTQWWAMESLHDLPPEQAQEKWLDEVLRLAIVAGVVQLEETP